MNNISYELALTRRDELLRQAADRRRDMQVDSAAKASLRTLARRRLYDPLGDVFRPVDRLGLVRRREVLRNG